MADDTAAQAETPAPEVNPPPEALRTQVFVLRETLALLFVGVWLLLFAGELVTQSYTVPFWFHCVSVGVLGYALGLNVAELTAYRPPSKRQAVRRVLAGREGEG